MISAVVITLERLSSLERCQWAGLWIAGLPRSRNDHELARIIVAHTKSKGIFDMVDMARFEQLS